MIVELKGAEYLGDGVYVRLSHGSLQLMTSDGIMITNEVFLESEVWMALVRWVLSQKLQGHFPVGGSDG